MKKIISIILMVAIMISSLACFAAPKNQDDIATLLSELDIMKGDPNGDLRLDDSVSRAEFTKVAIAVSSHRNSVAKNLTISPFKDVLYTHWAAPYIKLAVSNNICTGYPDATFKPNGTVTFEEAVTMLLKVLGYTDADFGISWPYGQVGLAEKIDLCTDIDKNIGDTLNRRDVMIMLYNLLNTEAKNANKDYIESMDYKIVEDTVLIATTNEDSSVGSNKIYTSTGLYEINDSFNHSNVGKKGDVILKNNDEFVSFIPYEQMINEYNIYQVLDNDVIFLDNGVMKPLDADKSLAVYNKTAKTTLKNMLTAISPGDILTTYKNSSGILDYGVIKTDELQGPYTVNSSDWIDKLGLSSSNLTIMRNGEKATADKIAINDIVYYSKPLSMIWSYSNKVTGVYEKALPNNDTPTKVVISDVTYTIESVSAFNKLASSGGFSYGDTVTVLLGKTNQIADVIAPNNTNSEVCGYMFETGKKEFVKSDNRRYTNNYIKIALPDGGVYEYIADKDYEDSINSVVKLTFKDGIAKANVQSYKSNISGEFNWSDKTLGNYKLSPEINILDITTLDENKVGDYTTLFPQRMDGITLSSSSILFSDINSNNEIKTLILNDVTGDAYDYGVVTKAETTPLGIHSSGKYTYDIGGKSSNLMSSTLYSVYSGQPAKFTVTSRGVLQSMQGLERIDGNVADITASKLTASGAEYQISNKVLVYKKSYDYTYTIMPLQDVLNSKDYTLTAYYDKPMSSGGLVRVIIATIK